MAPTAANAARFTFSTIQRPDDEFEVVTFVGREAISQPFRFELELISKNSSVPFSELVDQQAMLGMVWDGDVLPIHGVVVHFEQGGPVGDYYGYRAVLVPRLWRLSLTHQSRIFQQMSIPDIVERVLEANGFAQPDFAFHLRGSYPPREYCTQYQETDLAFVSRLLEHEGLCYFFEQEVNRDVLVITDDRSHFPPIEGDDTVTYKVMGGLAQPDEETVQGFVFREKIVTGKVILDDYNDRRPEDDLRVESQISDELPGVYYEYGPHYQNTGEGRRLARVRNEEIACRRREGLGEGTCVRLRAGHLFTLDAHYRLDLNQGYLLTEVVHFGSQRGALTMEIGEGDDTLPYRNEFKSIPASTPFRPQRLTPEPRVPGVMTAHIESTGGEYAHLDEHGRYRARMNFDLRDSGDAPDAEATLPIRMNQPYSGPNYGIHFPNHAKTEMVWACLNGDPDRPLALGTVPNAVQESPSSDFNPMQNIIRTASGHQFIMDDTRDEESILLHTPKLHRAIFDDKEDEIQIVTGRAHTAQFSDKNKQIVLRTGEKEHQIVMEDTDGGGSIRLTDKKGKLYITINVTDDNIQIVSMKGNIQLKAPEGNIELESKALIVKTTEGADIDVGTAIKTKIGDNATTEIGGKAETTIKGDAKTDISGKAETKAGMEMKLEAGTDVTVKAGMNLTSEAGMDHASKGLNVKSEAGVQNDVKGTLVNVQASSVNAIKGALVQIN